MHLKYFFLLKAALQFAYGLQQVVIELEQYFNPKKMLLLDRVVRTEFAQQ
jgi:hypothetical protein